MRSAVRCFNRRDPNSSFSSSAVWGRRCRQWARRRPLFLEQLEQRALLATIIIEKDTVPNDPQDFAFTTTGGLTPATFTLDDDSDGTLPNTQVYPNIAAGTYTVSETAVPGFSTIIFCIDPSGDTTEAGDTAIINLAADETVTCIFLNTKLATLVITKDTVPNDGQEFLFSTGGGLTPPTFTLRDPTDGTLQNTQTYTNVQPSSYTILEAPVPGFALTDLACIDPDGGTSVNLTAGIATVDLDPGETVSCTFTNTKLGTIVIVKDTVPDSGQDFSFTTTGGLTPATFSLDDDADGTLSNTQTFNNVAPGQYSVTEAAASGFSTSLSCADPDNGSSTSGATANIDLDAGETVTCTFVNSDLNAVGTIIVIKDTVPNDPQDFAFTTTGGLNPATFNLDDDDDSTLSNTQVYTSVPAGNYTITEPAVTGFETALTCIDPDSGTTTSGATATIDLDVGETITCTFTNSRLGTILIVKDAVPNDAQDFAFTTTGGLNPATFNLDDDDDGTLANTQAFLNVSPGPYTVRETLPVAGFELTSLTCADPDGGTSTDLAAGTATIDLDAGETITCTFQNSRPGTIVIIKDTVPDDPQDFSFTASGGLSPATFSLDDDSDNTLSNTQTYADVTAGTYTIAEVAVPGFTTTVSCTDPDGGTTTSEVTATIDLDGGETVSCTFTNAMVATIVIIKDTVPDDPQDFSFSTTGGLTPETFVLDDDSDDTLPNTQTYQDIAAGTYTVTESAVAGFSTQIACADPSGGTTTSEATATIDLDPAETVTCTFTNTKLGMLVIVKDAVPNDAQDFAFTTTGGLTPATFDLDDDSDDTLPSSQLFAQVAPGTYTVTETAVPGFTTSLSCVDPDEGSAVDGATATIDMDPGETIICTFVNTKLGTVIIVKDTLPDDPQDFGFTTTGGLTPATFNLDDDDDPTLSNTQTFENVARGSYTVAETLPVAGFALTALVCQDPDGGSTSDLAGGVATIDLDAGETITCTFENSKPGTIVIVKDTVPDNAQDFAFTTTGGLTPSTFILDDDADATLSNTQTYTNVTPGTYTVTETLPVLGFALTSLSCVDADGGTTLSLSTGTVTIDLNADEIVTCTFTNSEVVDFNLAKLSQLLASDGSAGDYFGTDVAVSGDTVVVGAPLQGEPGRAADAAYVYNCLGDSCTQAAKLTASDGAAGDQHGRSVAISGDMIVVGAPFHDDQGTDSGAAYVYKCDSTQSKGSLLASSSWQRLAAAKRAQALENCTEIAKLLASDGRLADYFGLDVSVSGKTVVVGAPGSITRDTSGAAYVFTCDDTSCTEVAKLNAGDAAGGDQFGLSVSVWGGTVVVGAPSDDDSGASSGGAYVFDCADNSCTQVAKLTANDGAAVDWFGASVDVAGNTVVVGAPNDFSGGIHSGSAYVFACGDGSCTQLQKLTASDAAKWNQFGASVAVANDDTIVVGAALSGPPTHAGAAFVFIRDGDTWNQKPKLDGGPAARTSDLFGSSVDISGDKVVVGVPRDDEQGLDSGSACVFVRVPVVSKPGSFTSSSAARPEFVGSRETTASESQESRPTAGRDSYQLQLPAEHVERREIRELIANASSFPIPAGQQPILAADRLSARIVDQLMDRLHEDEELDDLLPWRRGKLIESGVLLDA